MPRIKTTNALGSMTKRQTHSFLEKVFPEYYKSKRARNIVRRTLQKSKTKEFTSAVDNVLAAVQQVHSIGEQLTAMNPGLAEAQRDGTLARQHNEAVVCLCDAWEKLVGLV